jgi:hypothetical protein
MVPTWYEIAVVVLVALAVYAFPWRMPWEKKGKVLHSAGDFAHLRRSEDGNSDEVVQKGAGGDR